MLNALLQTALYPRSLRQRTFRKLIGQLPESWRRAFPYKALIDASVMKYPYYGYCMYNAALLARWLGHKTISAIELGVATGDGLVAAERHAREIQREIGVDFQLYGFDSGAGLPAPKDYRDMPFAWKEGDYALDYDAVKRRLEKAQLIIGQVKDTCADFCRSYQPAPIGCIFWDLDFYSSTIDGFQLFQAEHQYFLPRVSMYFDDIVGMDICDFTGERLAIHEFNARSEDAKISVEYDARLQDYPFPWKHQIFVYHNFSHPDYCRWVWEKMAHLRSPA